MRPLPLALRVLAAPTLLALLATSCTKTGQDWVHDLPEEQDPHVAELARETINTSQDAPLIDEMGPTAAPGERVSIHDDEYGGPRPVVEIEGAPVFRNTYYDFPHEGAGAKDATVFDASCAPLAQVTRDFHDRVCVQGSGRLASGETLSFARRDCACAAVCPRTGQKLCFERLDPARFPSGRGATGQPITPMRTIAVDPAVIPLGTSVFVPEFVGIQRPDGTPHDGCFFAEDRGLKVVGRQIDVFTGDPALTARWNTAVPSNTGVHVRMNEPRCAGR